MTPNNAWDSNHNPVQGAEEKALDRVPIFVGTKTITFISALDAEENKDSQGQSSAVSRQIGNNAVVKSFTGILCAAAEEGNQADKIDWQPPGKLKEIEKYPGPTSGSDRLIHMTVPLSF